MEQDVRPLSVHPGISYGDSRDNHFQILNSEEWQPPQTMFLPIAVHHYIPCQVFWAGSSQPHSSWVQAVATSLNGTNLWSDGHILVHHRTAHMMRGEVTLLRILGKGRAGQQCWQFEALGNPTRVIISQQLCFLSRHIEWERKMLRLIVWKDLHVHEENKWGSHSSTKLHVTYSRCKEVLKTGSHMLPR